MSDESQSQISTKVELREDGILWMLNTTVFHPRGLQLGVASDGQLYLIGDDSEVWVFEDHLAEQGFQAFNAMLERHFAKIPSAE